MGFKGVGATVFVAAAFLTIRALAFLAHGRGGFLRGRGGGFRCTNFFHIILVVVELIRKQWSPDFGSTHSAPMLRATRDIAIPTSDAFNEASHPGSARPHATP
ncbi:hypothetical protein [Caballeronia glathei]|uniref:hypothetical protein n=1 Tax=Caballeronia glathei TaxID=60547 RepID=UPI001F26A92B|nr:hypothetical protein [Caballeronia glathei]